MALAEGDALSSVLWLREQAQPGNCSAGSEALAGKNACSNSLAFLVNRDHRLRVGLRSYRGEEREETSLLSSLLCMLYRKLRPGRGGSGGGIHVTSWLIHVSV